MLSSLIGFDAQSERFLALDRDGKNYLTTKDGTIWVPVAPKEASEMINSSAFQMKQSGIPIDSSKTLSAIMNTSLGTPKRGGGGGRGSKDTEDATWLASKEALISRDKKPTVIWI